MIDFKLPPYEALPEKLNHRAVAESGVTLYSLSSAAQLRRDLRRAGAGSASLVLEILSTYTITAKRFDELSAEFRDHLSNIGYYELRQFFNLPSFGMPREIVPLYRSRLPLGAIREACEQVQHSIYEFGPLSEHDTAEARSRYRASLFRAALEILQGTIINRPEALPEGSSKTQHVFQAFEASVIVFVDEKWGGRYSRHHNIARVIAECELLDYGNATTNRWCPMLGILSDQKTVQLFVYNSSSREVYASKQLPVLLEYSSGLKFLQSVREAAEMFYDLFIIGYINGLRAWMASSDYPLQSAALALEAGMYGLAKHRKAAAIAGDGRYAEAEMMAKEAIACIKRSVRYSVEPQPQLLLPPIMSSWKDGEMMRC